MSLELFNLAMKKVNANLFTSQIYLSNKIKISHVAQLSVVKGYPNLAVATDVNGQFIYFSKKDLAAFSVDECVVEGKENDTSADEEY